MPPPSIDAHFKQAQGNERFYLDVLGGEASSNPEWAMTALFYAALHYVQAGCLNVGACPATHNARKKIVESDFRGIAAAYSKLYQHSCDARYECFKHQSADLRNAETLLARISAAINEQLPATK